MILWAFVIFILLPMFTIAFMVARAKPRGKPDCSTCLDGERLEDLVIEAKKGFHLALRCEGCNRLFRSKVSQMAFKPLEKEDLRRDFTPDAGP